VRSHSFLPNTLVLSWHPHLLISHGAPPSTPPCSPPLSLRCSTPSPLNPRTPRRSQILIEKRQRECI
jgi:hypothetical protein